MPTPTTRLGLLVNSESDPFLLANFTTNWDLLDSFPGVYINTHSAIVTEVGSWGSAQAWQYLYDTTNSVLWQWNGSTLIRPFANGLLGQNAATSNATVTSLTAVTVVSSESLTVPTGGRYVEVNGFVPSVSNTVAATTLELVMDSTVLQTVTVATTTAPTSRSLYSILTPSAGSHTFYIQAYVASSSTATLAAATTSPITLTVKEV